MSQPVSPSPSSIEIERLQREIAEKAELLQQVRQELIRSQITVLELQDTVLQKETDKADAVSLLGRAELLLESKINYIFDLDRALNEKIAALTTQLAESRATHENVTQDLVAKLDQTNRDLSAAHQLAGNYAREAAETKELLGRTTESRDELSRLRAELIRELSAARDELAAQRFTLEKTEGARTALERKLASIQGSFAWKISAPFRWLSKRD